MFSCSVSVGVGHFQATETNRNLKKQRRKWKNQAGFRRVKIGEGSGNLEAVTISLVFSRMTCKVLVIE